MEQESSLAELLPIIRRVVAARSSPGDGLDDIVAVYADRFVIFTARRKRPLPDAAYEPDGLAVLRRVRSIGPTVDLGWNDIGWVECSPRHFYGSRQTGSREEGREIRIHTARDATTRLFLPEDDAVLVRRAFSEILAERFADNVALSQYQPTKVLPRRNEGSPTTRRTLWLMSLFLVFILIGVAKAFFLPEEISANLPSSLTPVALCVGFGALLGALFNMGLAGSRAAGYENHYTKARRLEKLRTNKAQGDLSGRQAMRSRVLGWALKLIGGGVAVFAIVAGDLAYLAANDQTSTGGRVGGLVQTIFLLVAVVPIYYGYRLCQVSAERALTNDRRPPILFLRPFEIDGRTDLNPHGFLAQWLGLEAFGWLKKLGPFGNLHPLRLLRLFFSVTADHCEEQMARYFRRHGPFVAIGKPGERFSLGGASRFYVTNEHWQEAVLDLLQRAQFVVLQPSLTPGVRWEIEQTAKQVPPERILLCLTWFAGSQARYDEFRASFARCAGLHLPRRIGDASFACFDAQGRPALLPMRLRTPLAWPVSGCAVNFKETLRPFFARLKRGFAGVSPQPGKMSWFAQGAAAVCCWFPLLLAVDYAQTAAVGAVEGHWQSARLHNHVMDEPRDIVQSGRGWAWALQPSWKRAPEGESDPTMRVYRLGEEGLFVGSRIITVTPPETFTQEMDSAGLLQMLKAGANVTSERTPQRITMQGQEWIETEYDIEVDGNTLHFLVRCLARPSARFILLSWSLKDQFEQNRATLTDGINYFRVEEEE